MKKKKVLVGTIGSIERMADSDGPSVLWLAVTGGPVAGEVAGESQTVR